jgi:hypothetical protein
MLLPGIAAALNGFGGEAITFAFAPDPEALFGCRCVAGNAPDRARLDVAIQALAHLASRSDADSLCLDAIVPMLRNGLERGGMDTAIVTEALDCIDVRVALRD